jgi:DNA-binding response OmpR family regulator
MRILLIEDHQRLAELIGQGLGGFGFAVDTFATCEDGAAATRALDYEAIVLDLSLPDRDGLDFLRDLRAQGDPTPVLILTARDGVDNRVAGLDCGADDYVLKPVAMKELAARLRALLRRPGKPLGAVLSIRNVALNTLSRQVTINGEETPISRREFDALELLMRRAGQVVSKRAIEDRIYGLSEEVLPNTVEVLISRLRKRLQGMNADLPIHTLRGVGYLLAE